jgi:hypothetical protein
MHARNCFQLFNFDCTPTNTAALLDGEGRGVKRRVGSRAEIQVVGAHGQTPQAQVEDVAAGAV